MKLKKILAMSLMAITMITASSCTFLSDFTKDSADQTATEQESLLMGFDSVRELLTVYSLNVGQLFVNKDEEMISQGEASMQVSYLKEVGVNEKAADMEVAIMPGNKYFNKQNWEDTEYISVDIYNANASEYEVCVNIAGISIDFYTLKQGWNTIYTYFDRSIAKYKFNGGISAYGLTFRGKYGESPNFYVDNLQFHKTETAYERYTFDKEKEVWHTFENTAELTFFGNQGAAESIFSVPRYSINKNPKYVLTGKSSMRVDFKQKSTGEIDVTAFRTADNMMADLNKYLGDENWYIFFDVYNDYDYEISLDVLIFSNFNNDVYGQSIKIPAKSWSNPQTARIYLNEMEEAFIGNGLDCMTIAYYFYGITTEGSIYLDSIGIRK